MTYYTSLSYTNYTLVTDWYVAGNEIADHTYVLPLPLSGSRGAEKPGDHVSVPSRTLGATRSEP